ncbi:MAG: ComEC/Rec2 family competence protein, partial [Planctomycetota bacterium]|nr:ComEC/Rec2 family competence protein [Planctomycetota bacterium]
KPTAVLVAVVIGAYAMMTELKPPVVRAAILVAILCMGWATGRERLRLNSLAAAVLIILLVRPGDLFTTSFQLSFAVVLGMFYLVTKVEAVLFRRAADPLEDEEQPTPGVLWLPGYARRTVTLSLAAALVAVPLAANRFHLVGWLAPVASVALAPLVFLLIAGSMALVVLGAPAPWLGDLLAAIPDGMARAITGVVGALARVPGGHFYTAHFSWPWLVVTYGLLAAWVWRERLGLSRRRLALAVLAAAAGFLWTGGHRAPDAVRATFVAVGSGNTNLVELPSGRNLLYDAGSALSYARAGEGTIAPVLWWRGVERVDAAFISHAHFDHFKDVLPLVDRFGIRRVFVPPTFLRRRLSVDDAVVEALLARGVRVTYFGAGDRLTGTGRARVRGVWPRAKISQTDDINDGSLVLSVEDGGRRLLLTGDIEPPAIAGLIAAEPALRAGAVLWPHHGHAPEAARDLLRHTGARVAVISSARGWDPPPMPAWLAADGVTCYHTGRDGTVTVELGTGGVCAETFRGR